MKKIILALSFLFMALLVNAQKGHNGWLTNYEEALKQAKTENKKVLMAFSGSDWCRPCIMLSKEVFEKEAFKTYAHDNYILLYVNFPRKSANKLSSEQQKHNDNLAAKFNKKGDFPKVVVLNSDGSIVGSLGYISGGAKNYLDKLNTLEP